MSFRSKIILLVSLFLCFIIFQSRNENISGPFKGILGNILNPMVYITNQVLYFTEDLWSSYVYLIGVKNENEEYKKIIDNLTLQNTLLQEKVNQGKRLQSLLKFSEAYDFSTIPSNVIGASDGFAKEIIIDKGSLDGVLKNDPIIGFKGLVGRVSETYFTSSEVELILNLSSNVSVMNSRTRAVGILRGDGKGQLFIDYYDRLDEVKLGDHFITSGLGRLFPKGIPIGVVSKISKEQTGLFQKIYIKQTEDFYKLENVFVVKNFKK